MSEFSPGDLDLLGSAAKRVEDMSNVLGRRLVLEVWDEFDNGPCAWIEYYPGDSYPHIRFQPERPGDDS